MSSASRADAILYDRAHFGALGARSDFRHDCCCFLCLYSVGRVLVPLIPSSLAVYYRRPDVRALLFKHGNMVPDVPGKVCN